MNKFTFKISESESLQIEMLKKKNLNKRSVDILN